MLNYVKGNSAVFAIQIQVNKKGNGNLFITYLNIEVKGNKFPGKPSLESKFMTF